MSETFLQELQRIGDMRQGRWLLRIERGRYIMEDARNLIGGPRHELAIECTDEARLEAHWLGFVATNRERFGR